MTDTISMLIAVTIECANFNGLDVFAVLLENWQAHLECECPVTATHYQFAVGYQSVAIGWASR